ncbi:tail connector protein [Aeromonas phage 3]|nr:tail connector protein [Aeromonas phage 3]
MNKSQEAAPLLRPLITTEGLKAAVQASTLGVPVKIVKVGITATPGEATVDDTSLPGAQMLDVADGRLVNSHQVNISTLLPDTFPSMGIAGIAFYLEDGTMFAVYREPEAFLDHTGGTTLLVGMDLVMDNIPSDSVIVESTDANLILGDWVPVERTVNGKALTGDIALTPADVKAVSLTGDRMAGKLEWIDANRYITAAGSDLYVAAKAGKVIIEGKTGPVARVSGQDFDVIHTGNLPKTDLSGYVPTGRKVNGKPLTDDIELNAADVNAVGKTGPQSMTGQLNGVKFTATNNYAFVSNLRQNHGLYLGMNDNDRRTLIGGGGAEVGDKLGTIHLRPGGITDQTGEVVVTVDGNVLAPTDPSASGHLTHKGYVDKAAAAIKDLFKEYVPLSGAILTGALTAKATLKGAFKLQDKASVSYQDGGNAVFHTFASGNTLQVGHGNDGSLFLARFVSDGSFESAGRMLAQTTVTAVSPNKAKTITIEAPDAGDPYLASRGTGEATGTRALTLGKDEVYCHKRLAANTMRVTDDAGLKFGATVDGAGKSWGVGMNPAGTFGFHIYDNNVWKQAPLQLSQGLVSVNGNLSATGSLSATGYSTIVSPGNNILEFHQPGRNATMVYMPDGTGSVRFASSNGAGGESAGYGEIGAFGFRCFNKFSAEWNNARSWHSWGYASLWAGNRPAAGDGHLFGLVSQQLTSPAGGYQVEMFYGQQTYNDLNRSAHIFAAQGDGYLKAWELNNGGQITSPGGWRIATNGDLYSPRLGSQNIVDWCVSSFSPKTHSHTAAEGNLSMVQGRHSEVGTYMFAALHVNAGGPYNPGRQVPGNLLYPAACGEWSQNRGLTFPGTWMCCGYVDPNNDDRYDDRSTLWFRVA